MYYTYLTCLGAYSIFSSVAWFRNPAIDVLPWNDADQISPTLKSWQIIPSSRFSQLPLLSLFLPFPYSLLSCFHSLAFFPLHLSVSFLLVPSFPLSLLSCYCFFLPFPTFVSFFFSSTGVILFFIFSSSNPFLLYLLHSFLVILLFSSRLLSSLLFSIP